MSTTISAFQSNVRRGLIENRSELYKIYKERGSQIIMKYCALSADGVGGSATKQISALKGLK